MKKLRSLQSDFEKSQRNEVDRIRKQYTRNSPTEDERKEQNEVDRIRKQKKKKQSVRYRAAQSCENVKVHCLGSMNVECTACAGLHFSEEKVKGKSTFNDCCSHGNCLLEELPVIPDELQNLL